MIKHIKCPFHEDGTASLALYPDGGHCFGCGWRGPLSAVGIAEQELPPPQPPEDLEASIARILSLPQIDVRGFRLHVDDRGYYILWPDHSYYKQRMFSSEKGKYRNPSGHKQPLLLVRNEGNRVLVIVEGEMNAMSVAAACPDVDVWSPGSAGNFKAFPVNLCLKMIPSYSIIGILADRDAPGAEACIELMSKLQGLVPTLKAHLMSPDANEVLLGSGAEVLKTQIYQAIGFNVEEEPAEGQMPGGL